jgi:hypothetical protein
MTKCGLYENSTTYKTLILKKIVTKQVAIYANEAGKEVKVVKSNKGLIANGIEINKFGLKTGNDSLICPDIVNHFVSQIKIYKLA